LQEITPHLIRKAFDLSFEIIGENTKKVIIEDLERQGILFSDHELTLTKLFEGIRQIIGDDASDILAERVIVKLDEFYQAQRE
jgi:hypothetical protein